jgi:hypothetical protein
VRNEGGGRFRNDCSTFCGAVRVDEGCMALRSRPAEGGSKPPTTALAKDRCGERRGKSRDSIPAGVSRRDERRPKFGPCRLKRRKHLRRHQNQSLGATLGRVWEISAYCPGGVRRKGSMNPVSGSRTEHEKACQETAAGRPAARGRTPSGRIREGQSTVVRHAGGLSRVAVKPGSSRSAWSQGEGLSR